MTTPKVLLGVTGGIAACKAPQIVRSLRAAGADVRCALTPAARSFVTPLTLEVLSGHPVYGEEYLEPGVDGQELHVVAAQWADVVLVAPATANTLAQLALGLAPDFLTTTALMGECPLAVAPAMHHQMWNHPAVRARVDELRDRGVRVLGPVRGALANGEIGDGRLMEPDDIVQDLLAWLRPAAEARLRGRRVVIAAGPTHEPLDPVRFLGNRSSGKMGFALAEAAAEAGATVDLVAGPCALTAPPGVQRHDVRTALEMEAAVGERAVDADLVIMAAAVADFRPAEAAESKIKKTPGTDDAPEIRLVRNPDILAGLADVAPGAIRVGFAAETDDVLRHAQSKLERKRVHAIVANDVSRSDIGFSSDHNEVVVLRKDGEPLRLERRQKRDLARSLIELFADLVTESAGVEA